MTMSLWLSLLLLIVSSSAVSLAEASLWRRSHLFHVHRSDVMGAPQTCHGPLGVCINRDNEEAMMLDPEITRRALVQGQRYISYAALKQDNVPCKQRGRSYYNCGASGRANPYQRGCSVITHCYRFTN
ncbi:hypothetical protein SLEP1_g6776 [Rubroshorea leprosula]|uniref:Rapid ALkalinization Factor n=1 Tax=Rubroshorea leprosula TaxID=152421 RepID=A0AAV5I5H3_9ROSI|nr:hypothetical protein SLEP1_g6776 [Rubroshorea leprosula]